MAAPLQTPSRSQKFLVRGQRNTIQSFRQTKSGASPPSTFLIGGTKELISPRLEQRLTREEGYLRMHLLQVFSQQIRVFARHS
jgi:hypothetical protein